LIYVGSIGTGWSHQLGRSIMAAVQRNGRDDPPFVAVPKPDAKDARWADPKLVAEVQFTTWTRDGRCGIRASSRMQVVPPANYASNQFLPSRHCPATSSSKARLVFTKTMSSVTEMQR